jgi:hypothetical protein
MLNQFCPWCVAWGVIGSDGDEEERIRKKKTYNEVDDAPKINKIKLGSNKNGMTSQVQCY